MPFEGFSSRPTLEVRWASVRELRAAITADHAEAHWRESGTHHDEVPLDPDWQEYQRLERIGAYRCMAAWRRGKLAGYAGYLVTPSSLQHRTTPHALNISIYTAPWARGIGALITRRAEHELAYLVHPKKIRIVQEVPTGNPRFGTMLERLGYKQFGVIYEKVVRAE